MYIHTMLAICNRPLSYEGRLVQCSNAGLQTSEVPQVSGRQSAESWRTEYTGPWHTEIKCRVSQVVYSIY